MNRVWLGLACATVLGIAACASEEIDETPFLGSSGGRAGAASLGSGGRGGSPASNGGRSAGPSGTAGSLAGASFNGTGGMSVVGASGSGSSNGGTSAGTSGTTGNAGGGGAPVFESGTCASSPRMSLSYQQMSNNPKQITALYQFRNTTDTPIPLAQLKIRYLFSNEETSGWSTAIYDAKLDGGSSGYRPIAGATLAVLPLGASLPGADSYLELSFAGSTLSIEKGAIATVNWDLQPKSYSPPDQVQTNDYSYNAAAVAYTAWDHVLIYQGSDLVWGCTPKSADGGSGGTSSAGTGGTFSGGAGGALNGGSGGAGATDGGTSGAAAAGTAGASSGAAGTGAGGVSSGGSGGAAVAGSAGASGTSGAGASGASGSSVGGALGAGAGGASSSGSGGFSGGA